MGRDAGRSQPLRVARAGAAAGQSKAKTTTTAGKQMGMGRVFTVAAQDVCVPDRRRIARGADLEVVVVPDMHREVRSDRRQHPRIAQHRGPERAKTKSSMRHTRWCNIRRSQQTGDIGPSLRVALSTPIPKARPRATFWMVDSPQWYKVQPVLWNLSSLLLAMFRFWMLDRPQRCRQV